jgi:hypothetical protein
VCASRQRLNSSMSGAPLLRPRLPSSESAWREWRPRIYSSRSALHSRRRGRPSSCGTKKSRGLTRS